MPLACGKLIDCSALRSSLGKHQITLMLLNHVVSRFFFEKERFVIVTKRAELSESSTNRLIMEVRSGLGVCSENLIGQSAWLLGKMATVFQREPAESAITVNKRYQR